MSARLFKGLSHSSKSFVTQRRPARPSCTVSVLVSIAIVVLATDASARGSGTFKKTGDMTIGRSGCSVTLLLNGEVLLAGGFIPNPSPQNPMDTITGPVDTAELYNPVTRTFTQTGSMTAARSDQSATLLPNGKVLLAGGSGLDSAELYDPASGTFAPTGKMSFGRTGPSAVLLLDGKVLVAGGGNSPPPGAELYDSTTGQFTATGSTQTQRSDATANLLANGDVLITGGSSLFGNDAGTADYYDSASGTFRPPIDMTAPHEGGTSTLLLDGRALIAGGGNSFDLNLVSSNSDLFAPRHTTFFAGPQMTVPRLAQAAALLANGQVLIADGSNLFENNYLVNLSSAELYDPVQNKFLTTGSTLVAGHGAVAALSDGTVLLPGAGVSPDPFGPPEILAEAEIYTPASMPVIKIVSPLNYSIALLGSPRIIYTRIGPNVSWVNVYIDGKYLKSSPPFQFVWSPSTTGAHQISVKAYNSTNQPIGTDAVTLDVTP
jgi:hypothetical protein